MTIKSFVFNPIQENTYILFDQTGEAAIVDAGCYSKNEEALLDAFIMANNLKIKRLLNTHLHFDHILGNRHIAQHYGILPEAAKEDEFMIETLGETMRSFGFNYRDNEQGQALGGYLNENDTVKFGNTELKILHVPGHSPGSLCFLAQEDGILLSGDVLFRNSVGRTDLPYGNHAQLLQGIEEKLLSLPDNVTVYPGHGASTTIGYERRMNPFL